MSLVATLPLARRVMVTTAMLPMVPQAAGRLADVAVKGKAPEPRPCRLPRAAVKYLQRLHQGRPRRAQLQKSPFRCTCGFPPNLASRWPSLRRHPYPLLPRSLTLRET